MNAAAKTNEELQDKIANFSKSEMSNIMAALKESAVDSIKVEQLEKEMALATNKNKILLNVINKGEVVGKALVEIISKL